MTKTQIRTKALERGETLTPLTAAEKYNCFSLSQRMGDLISKGMPIIKGWEKHKDGQHRTYRLVK